MDHSDVPPLGDQVRHQLQVVMDGQNLSMSALGRAAGTSTTTVRRVLNGEKHPTLEMVDRLFRAAGVVPVLSYE